MNKPSARGASKAGSAFSATAATATAFLLALALWVGAPAAQATSSPPDRMTYQGFLVDANGNPLAPSTPINYSVVFRVYAASDPGTPAGDNSLWTEQQIVTVDKGSFSVVLGEGTKVGNEPHDTTPLSSVFTGSTASDRYLGITVTIGASALVIDPRLRLLPAPYAFLATQATQLIDPSTGSPFMSLSGTDASIPGVARFGNDVYWGTGARLRPDQGGSLELGNSGAASGTPYIDFHFGNSTTQDYNVRLANDYNGGLTQYGNLRINGVGSYPHLTVASQTAASTPYGAFLSLDATSLTGGKKWFIFSTGNTAGEGQGKLVFQNAAVGITAVGNNALVLTPGGAVGVGGITSPKATLHNPGDYYGKGHVWLHAYEGDGLSGTAYVQARDDSGFSSIDIQFRTQKAGSLRDVMRITQDNRVGINNNAPLCPLQVSGANTTPAFTLEAYMDVNGAVNTFQTRNDLLYSIISDYRIRAGTGVDVLSDARIKKVLQVSDNRHDLETLTKIQITDFVYKDAPERGTAPQKKVIAQQVETVYPDAVHHSTGVVPDIYEKAPLKDGWIHLATDLKKGDRVRVIGKNKDDVQEVLEVAEGRFRTASLPEGDSVFVYGREVKDFRSVDYDAIAMLNVSATQELVRKVAAQELELAELRKQAAARDASIVQWEKRFAAMEKALAAVTTLRANPEATPAPVLAANPAQ